MVTRFRAELATASITAAFGLAVMIGATEFGIGWVKSGPEPGTFPFYMGLLVTVASIGTVIQTVLSPALRGEAFLDAAQCRAVAAFVLPMVAFVVVSKLLGLYAATALYLFGSMLFQGGYRVWSSAAVAIAAPVVLYLVLEKAFKVYLLKGPIESALGF